MTNEKFNQAIAQMSKFSSLEAARGCVDHSIKIQMILMGDGSYWVGSPRWTEYLHQGGYEYIK